MESGGETMRCCVSRVDRKGRGFKQPVCTMSGESNVVVLLQSGESKAVSTNPIYGCREFSMDPVRSVRVVDRTLRGE